MLIQIFIVLTLLGIGVALMLQGFGLAFTAWDASLRSLGWLMFTIGIAVCVGTLWWINTP